MINRIELKGLTLFSNSVFVMSNGFNIVIGENSSGKTHLLKMIYSVMLSIEAHDFLKSESNEELSRILILNLLKVFRVNSIEKLISLSSNSCEVNVEHGRNGQLRFKFQRGSPKRIEIINYARSESNSKAVLIPIKEIVSFISEKTSYDSLEEYGFDKSYSDLAVKLRSKGSKKYKLIDRMPPLLREDVGILSTNARETVIAIHGDRIPISLASDGTKKILQLSTLIRNGEVIAGGCILWDEPESNLNPKNLRLLLDALAVLALEGVQIILTTHSLYVIRYAEYIIKNGNAKFFNFIKSAGNIIVIDSSTVSEIGDIASLEEEEKQIEQIMVDYND